MIKLTILLIRNPNLSYDEFVEHHKTRHADLFMSIPAVKDTVRRYIQQHTIQAELPGLPPVKFDGITELWFDDIHALGRCFSDPEYLSKVRPDEVHFLDLGACEFVLSTEHPVLV